MILEVHGKRVFASTGGKPYENAAPCVIFLHGSGLDHSFWDCHAAFFASENYAVLCPDLPGHSASAGPPLESIEAMAEWLHEVVEVLGAGNLSIVGHSQGGLIALEFVSRHPERVRSVSLITSGLRIAVNPALIEAAEHDPDQAVAMMSRWSFAAGEPPQRAARDALASECREILQRNASLALAADLRANDAYVDGQRVAAQIRKPVQVMVGGKDRMIPESASDELIAELHRPQVHVFGDSGHMLPLEAPEECRALLSQFVSENNPIA
ncbi:MAG: alpha/beta hydrolase [Woeseiaceae bacterium]|nr:alpha/beta hydrolase [Woeseiaceae bacterium]